MNDQATLARFDAAVQALPAREPTLLELARAAVAADEAFNRLCREQVGEPTSDEEVEFMAAEEAQIQTREALYEALAQIGIDRALASRMGGVLL